MLAIAMIAMMDAYWSKSDSPARGDRAPPKKTDWDALEPADRGGN